MVKALLITAALFVNGVNDKAVKVNTTESTINWTGTKIVGGGHNGTIAIKEGSLDIDKKGVLKGGSFVIDMNSMACTDLTGEYKGKLEGHLKSDDFFSVATFPEASFKSTNIVSNGNGKFTVTGDITIKGKTETISFDATLSEEGKNYVATAMITIDRSKFDVRYGSGSFFDNLGDKAISDDFTLDVKLVAGK